MHFNTHLGLGNSHAFLSASKYHWINYDQDKLTENWINAQNARRGIELHEFAHNAIRLGIKLPRSGKTLNTYVNDAIGFRMATEQVLLYSLNCYGTTDAIAYTRSMLRIHDLKTGVNPGSMHQLEIYAALFCLEYAVKPGEIQIELRIYQNDEVEVSEPSVDVIGHIMSKIIVFDNHIENLKMGG